MNRRRGHPILQPDTPKPMRPSYAPIPEAEERYRKGLMDVVKCTHDAATMRIIAIAALGGRIHDCD